MPGCQQKNMVKFRQQQHGRRFRQQNCGNRFRQQKSVVKSRQQKHVATNAVSRSTWWGLKQHHSWARHSHRKRIPVSHQVNVWCLLDPSTSPPPRPTGTAGTTAVRLTGDVSNCHKIWFWRQLSAAKMTDPAARPWLQNENRLNIYRKLGGNVFMKNSWSMTRC